MGLSSKWNIVVFVYCMAYANLLPNPQHTYIIDIIPSALDVYRKHHKFDVPYMGYSLPLQGNSMNNSRVIAMAL
jgi:hypothetical protein